MEGTHRSAPLAPAVNRRPLPVVAATISPVKEAASSTIRGTARDMSQTRTTLQEQLRGTGQGNASATPQHHFAKAVR